MSSMSNKLVAPLRSLEDDELDGFDDERLVAELKKAKEELFNLRFQSATG